MQSIPFTMVNKHVGDRQLYSMETSYCHGYRVERPIHILFDMQLVSEHLAVEVVTLPL